MSAKLTTLMYGELTDLNALLDSESCDEGQLRAALQNLIEHIRLIENRLTKLERRTP